jgi:hypothetical protein
MAGSRVTPVPFVFLLALASEAHGSQIPLSPEAKDQFKPGMLSHLFKQDRQPTSAVGSVGYVRDGKTTTVVQFANCAYGSWRKC